MIDAIRSRYHETAWPAFWGAYVAVSCSTATAIGCTAPDTFVRMNALWLLLWATSTAVAVACFGQWYVHRRFAQFDFVRHNEVGGFIIAVVGAVYGVLL
ncbi:MAG: hypothetical protein JOY69_10185, partial [Candidatus Eremiobacteraeota bacterium]|nr:hypothetical protein [Candidatus Eremiobacteraeota bacterium]